jgi:ABC-type lipoprotein export system ATPase subunit
MSRSDPTKASPDRNPSTRSRHEPTRTVRLRCIRRHRPCRPTRRTAEVRLAFGLPIASTRTKVLDPIDLPLGHGRIVLLLGPSGSGKSSALGVIERRIPGSCLVGGIVFPEEASILDHIAVGAPLEEALGILSTCALGEPRLWVRRFNELSDGERFRARLARAIGVHCAARTQAPLLCDEFCTGLHRRAAKAVSFNLRKLASRRGLSVVVASSQDDIVADLRPDAIVRLDGEGGATVHQYEVRPARRISFARRLEIVEGRKRDYDAFAAMHYRATEELGFVSRVFVLRERGTQTPLGIVVYSHPPLELSMRNRATQGRFSHNATELNRCVRILRRLVIHPDIRGCGVGHHLVRRTLPLVGTEYVECLAAMGAFNPVFERAGMRRIGQYGLNERRRAALDALRRMGVDPNGRAFPAQVCRSRAVRAIVTDIVRDWYANTTGRGERRVERQSPEFLAQLFRGLIGARPVYYLWRNPAFPRELDGSQPTCRTRREARTTRPAPHASRGARSERRDSPSTQTPLAPRETDRRSPRRRDGVLAGDGHGSAPSGRTSRVGRAGRGTTP